MGTVQVETGEVYGEKAQKAGQPKTKPSREKVRDNAFIYVDEGQTLSQQGQRLGSTIYSSLRTAWTGETLGQANAREDTTRHVPDGSYSLGLVIGYQENTAQQILGDATAGTPQRFAFCWTDDPSIPDEPPDHPGALPLDLDAWQKGMHGKKITFYSDINKELWQDNLAKARGQVEIPEMDSQKPLMLAKMSALLCIIDGRSIVTLEDWALARVMYDTSQAVISRLQEYGRELVASKYEASADAHANREAKAQLARQDANQNVHRIGVWLYTYVAAHGGVVTKGDAKRSAASRTAGCSKRL